MNQKHSNSRLPVKLMQLMLAVAALPFLTGWQHVPTRKPLSLKELRTQGCNMQSHQYSCGAAALATVMTTLGETTNEAEILNLIFGKEISWQVDEKGDVYLPPLTLADLEKAARAKDFRVISAKMDGGEEALNSIKSLKPIIARLLLHGDILHFVVIKDIQDEWVYISDPSYGNFKIPSKQFYKVWAEGDKVMLTISKNQFYALESEDKKVYLKRNDEDIILDYGDIGPRALFRSALESIISTE